MRTNPMALAGALAVSAVLLVGGCDQEKCEAVATAASFADQSAGLRKAAEDSIRVSAKFPDSVRFRGVQVWPQADRSRFAICGQVRVFGPTSNTYVLFVALVTQDSGSQHPARTFSVDARVGSTVTEAARAYIDTLARCYEGAGPKLGRREAAPAVPPMPDDLNAVLTGAAPPTTQPSVVSTPAIQQPSEATTSPVPSFAPASGTVVMRQNGNIRTSPKGETVRVEPQGKELRVFGEAPGGWLQIGDSSPNGWVHSSLVERP